MKFRNKCLFWTGFDLPGKVSISHSAQVVCPASLNSKQIFILVSGNGRSAETKGKSPGQEPRPEPANPKNKLCLSLYRWVAGKLNRRKKSSVFATTIRNWMLLPQKHPQTLQETYVFILVGVLGLRGVGNSGVAVGAIVFTVIVRCSGVRHDQELLDVTLRGRKDRVSGGTDGATWSHQPKTAVKGINTTKKRKAKHLAGPPPRHGQVARDQPGENPPCPGLG